MVVMYLFQSHNKIEVVVFDNIVQDVPTKNCHVYESLLNGEQTDANTMYETNAIDVPVYESLLNGEQADANTTYETNAIAVPVYESLLNGEQAEANYSPLYNTIATLYIAIIHSRSVVFISTFSSMKSELFLKKGGVILSLWLPIVLLLNPALE